MRVRQSISAALLLSCVLNVSAQTTTNGARGPTRHNLMPVPASVRFNAGRLAVNKSFTVAARGHVDERLRAGIERAMRRLEGRTVFEFARGLAADASAATLVDRKSTRLNSSH